MSVKYRNGEKSNLFSPVYKSMLENVLISIFVINYAKNNEGFITASVFAIS